MGDVIICHASSLFRRLKVRLVGCSCDPRYHACSGVVVEAGFHVQTGSLGVVDLVG